MHKNVLILSTVWLIEPLILVYLGTCNLWSPHISCIHVNKCCEVFNLWKLTEYAYWLDFLQNGVYKWSFLYKAFTEYFWNFSPEKLKFTIFKYCFYLFFENPIQRILIIFMPLYQLPDLPLLSYQPNFIFTHIPFCRTRWVQFVLANSSCAWDLSWYAG